MSSLQQYSFNFNKSLSYKKHSFASIAEQLIYTTISRFINSLDKKDIASLNDSLLTLFEK